MSCCGTEGAPRSRVDEEDSACGRIRILVRGGWSQGGGPLTLLRLEVPDKGRRRKSIGRLADLQTWQTALPPGEEGDCSLPREWVGVRWGEWE